MGLELNDLFDYMNNKTGYFSNNLLSLQLQLQSLLEGAGGDRSIEFLDRLAELNPSEQQLALSLFNKVIDKIKKGQIRLTTARDRNLKEFEEDLYRDLLGSMREAANCQTLDPTRFDFTKLNGAKIEVLRGGKATFAEKPIQHKGPIDLAEARRNRKSRFKPVLN